MIVRGKDGRYQVCSNNMCRLKLNICHYFVNALGVIFIGMHGIITFISQKFQLLVKCVFIALRSDLK